MLAWLKDEYWWILLCAFPVILHILVLVSCNQADRLEREFQGVTPETHPIVYIEEDSATELTRKVNFLISRGYEVTHQSATSNWLDGVTLYATLEAKEVKNIESQ